MIKDFPTDPTPVTLADKKEYHLRFNFSAVRKVKAQFGKTLQEMVKEHSIEDILLFALPLGIVEGVTAEALENELLFGPMTQYVFGQFVTSFFSKDEIDFWDAAILTREAALTKIRASAAMLSAEDAKTIAE